jgi:hypothetical protein
MTVKIVNDTLCNCPHCMKAYNAFIRTFEGEREAAFAVLCQLSHMSGDDMCVIIEWLDHLLKQNVERPGDRLAN